MYVDVECLMHILNTTITARFQLGHKTTTDIAQISYHDRFHCNFNYPTWFIWTWFPLLVLLIFVYILRGHLSNDLTLLFLQFVYYWKYKWIWTKLCLKTHHVTGSNGDYYCGWKEGNLPWLDSCMAHFHCIPRVVPIRSSGMDGVRATTIWDCIITCSWWTSMTSNEHFFNSTPSTLKIWYFTTTNWTKWDAWSVPVIL